MCDIYKRIWLNSRINQRAFVFHMRIQIYETQYRACPRSTRPWPAWSPAIVQPVWEKISIEKLMEGPHHEACLGKIIILSRQDNLFSIIIFMFIM